MLLLTRTPGQVLIFPGVDIKIRVVEVKGQKVRISVEAPKDVKVYREEVHRRMQEEAGD